MSRQEKIKLLPCPFCGVEAVVEETSCETLPGLFYMVKCQHCPAFIELSDRGASISAWNSRAPSEREKAPDIVVRALKAMAEEKMAVGFDETNVRKCCETKPEEAHDPECLVFHALAALGDA